MPPNSQPVKPTHGGTAASQPLSPIKTNKIGNIVTYQIKILFNKGMRDEWMQKHSLTDTLNYLRGNNWSYEVPIVISPDYKHYQFGEKSCLFEDLGPDEAKQKLINEIWDKDESGCIHKIYYRSSDDGGRNDTIFSSVKGRLSCERFCRYGFDQIVFKLKANEEINVHEYQNLKITNNLINLNGSYLCQNCRTQILSYEKLLDEENFNTNDVFQTLTSFTTERSHFPESFQPVNLNDDLKLFFRICEVIKFKWKGRETLLLENISNEKFQDCYAVKSNDYWDNVVDLEYYKDHNVGKNLWNLNDDLDEEIYRR